MEESISKAAGANFGEFVEPVEFRRLIRSIGRTPAERTTSYKIRRTFAADASDEPFESTRSQVAVGVSGGNSASPLPLLGASDGHPPHAVTHGESAY
jgi:hypothetical protein